LRLLTRREGALVRHHRGKDDEKDSAEKSGFAWHVSVRSQSAEGRDDRRYCEAKTSAC